ncbi:MAG: aldehyde dehydrogenase family protein [Clostridia bacterium]
MDRPALPWTMFWVQEDRTGELLDGMARYIHKFFGPCPLDREEYPRIINEKHYDRLCGLMREGKTAIGGQRRRETLQIAPTVITHVNGNSSIMREEIFGPLLPVIPYHSLESAIRFIKRREKPFGPSICLRNRIPRRSGAEPDFLWRRLHQ